MIVAGRSQWDQVAKLTMQLDPDAEPLRIAPNVRYAAEFERLAGEAKTEGLGLWGVPVRES